ncbi:MAG: NAD-dependent epimerase/dehydratase family protein [Armatimonadota bacterium]
MRYFVTGGTGFIGGRVAHLLAAQGHDVVALVRRPAAAQELAGPGIRLHPGDITDIDSIRDGMRGADGVFHIAAWYKVGVRDSAAAERINVEGTRNVLRLLGDLKIPRGVYTSTLAVFGDTRGRVVDETYRAGGPWLSEYDRTKWKAHYEVAEPMMRAGLPLVIVQPGLTYGPGDASTLRETLVQYLRGRLGMLPGRTAYCWGHVDDTVRGHIQAMERGAVGASYIIAGPPHTVIEAFTAAERLTGIKAPRWHVAPGLMRLAAGLVRPVDMIVALPPLYASETLRVMAGVTYLGSNARAVRELGFAARPLADGLRDTLAHEMRLLGIPPRTRAS